VQGQTRREGSDGKKLGMEWRKIYSRGEGRTEAKERKKEENEGRKTWKKEVQDRQKEKEVMERS
jgi:hypothetical protein